MLKNYDIILTKKISLHFGEEPLFYLIPTIGFQKLDWSAGINIKNKWMKK
jgi:hypothetical protein